MHDRTMAGPGRNEILEQAGALLTECATALDACRFVIADGDSRSYAGSLASRARQCAQLVDGLREAPVEISPATRDLVARFARALLLKLAKAEEKYGYSDGWLASGWMGECREQLRKHIDKGDPRDVAAYCAFLWHHGERTSVATHRHVRRGSTYTELGRGLLQTEALLADLSALVCYVGEDGRLWFRPPAEFDDPERFATIAADPLVPIERDARRGKPPCGEWTSGAPIDMVLHCPACWMQHIDAPEWTDDPHDIEQGQLRVWSNPPHRSHLCHGCGHIWRPADAPTNGVAAVTTKGKADSPTAPFVVGDRVMKVTGDYRIGGEVRSVFVTRDGSVRVAVEHGAEGGGSFLHIYSASNLAAAGPLRDGSDG